MHVYIFMCVLNCCVHCTAQRRANGREEYLHLVVELSPTVRDSKTLFKFVHDCFQSLSVLLGFNSLRLSFFYHRKKWFKIRRINYFEHYNIDFFVVIIVYASPNWKISHSGSRMLTEWTPFDTFDIFWSAVCDFSRFSQILVKHMKYFNICNRIICLHYYANTENRQKTAENEQTKSEKIGWRIERKIYEWWDICEDTWQFTITQCLIICILFSLFFFLQLYISNVLIAVNPFKEMDKLYSFDIIAQYQDVQNDILNDIYILFTATECNWIVRFIHFIHILFIRKRVTIWKKV